MPPPPIPEDIRTGETPALNKLRIYAQGLPYEIESNQHLQAFLDTILTRIAQCVEAKDYEPGLIQWDSMLSYWMMMKYPLPKEKRIALAKVYFEVAMLPGLPISVLSTCVDTLHILIRSKKKLSVTDMRLPWKPIWDVLSKDLFLSRRQFEIGQISYYMGFIGECCRRFFHPAAIDDMLQSFLPLLNGSNLDQILATQYYMVTFLPLSHPQAYLPMIFRMWDAINSHNYDERLLYFLAQLAEMHVDPTISDPKRIQEIPDDARDPNESQAQWNKDDIPPHEAWKGITKEVGIFNEEEWSTIMCKCLASMEIPLADSGSLATGTSVDGQAGFELDRLPKSTWRIFSLARIIVYSMATDGIPASSPSGPGTPFTPGESTPQPRPGHLGDYLSASLGAKPPKMRKYLAGCKALDSLARMIISTESFFHPSNSGPWTADLSAFIKYIVYEFTKRWQEEQKPTCKTPKHRRLTPAIRRELVRCLRTVALLAMFSRDGTTVSNIQSALKSMTIMEPDLIVPPVLERAIPSLEAVIETHRTTAVMKALGAVALGLASRDIYYPGAKYLLPILELLLPGIDLNDPTKTLCCTAFLVEIAQYVKFGDLTELTDTVVAVSPPRISQLKSTSSSSRLKPSSSASNIRAIFQLKLPEANGFGYEDRLNDDGMDTYHDGTLTREERQEEDVLLRQSTGDFASWVTNFFRRVINLLENLPDEGGSSNPGGDSEVTIVDALAAAASQICVHLSEELYDLVLAQIFDYASNNVRPNAVRAVHQLVECVANANPKKTLALFVPFCIRNIRIELENGASSLRTTSSSRPLPSDATLHWNLAILRGAMYNDGRAILVYKDELKAILKLLHERTFSKRGYSWTGKLLSSILLTCTHTYPLENKFVNPDVWASEEFRNSHHLHWGKLYAPEEVQVVWHKPTDEEIAFALEILQELVNPTLDELFNLLKPGITRGANWRNDFCRHLNFARSAFSGMPTIAREFPPDPISSTSHISDILNELREFIADVPMLNCGFPLSDKDDPRHKIFRDMRNRFGEFLHLSSESLRQQGDENTVDAVHSVLRSLRTFLFEYGDARNESYYVQREQFQEEQGLARQYADQRRWPRALYVRRARLYHGARLRWAAIERLRGELQDSLIDDIVEWATWQYASVRSVAQSILETMCSSYDGLRQRCLPKLYEALKPGTDDDRMKGALFTLNTPVFAKYAMTEPTMTGEFTKNLFKCQHNEKPSIQDCLNVMAENCLAHFVEPCYLVYSIESPRLEHARKNLEQLLPPQLNDKALVLRSAENQKARLELLNKCIADTTAGVTELANSPTTHWRYGIMAVRCLRTLIRRDKELYPPQLRFLLEKCHADHPSIRYYAQRGIMKSLRYLKIRTYSHTPANLALQRSFNPLKVMIPISNPTHEFTKKFLQDFRSAKFDRSDKSSQMLFKDKVVSGWLAWRPEEEFFRVPDASQSTFQPWDAASQPAILALREVVMQSTFWEKLTGHYAEETSAETTSGDNISCVKSIFQVLEDECFDVLKPIVEKLINNTDLNKQRAAAEVLCGVFGGSKHWPLNAQDKLWAWFMPLLPKVLGQNVKTDTLQVWTSFLEYMLCNKDPRRVQPLIDYLVEKGVAVDYNGESSFDAVKIICFVRAMSEELGWRFSAWTETFLENYWKEIGSDHDEVRGYIADALELSGKIKWQPQPSVPTAEAFVRECRTSPQDFDIMGVRAFTHKDRFMRLLENLPKLRTQRISGPGSDQSTYDKIGTTLIKWLFLALHDVQAVSTFDYILPLMPELFQFSELSDNASLAQRASTLLVRMCGVTPPRALIDPLLDAIFTAIESKSWRIRLKALPLAQVFYFRQMPLITEEKVDHILQVICACLDDEVIEVRQMASTTLSGILRCSPRHSILRLKMRFVRLARQTPIPPRQAPGYQAAILTLHSAILGVAALIEAHPYRVPHFFPELLTEVLSRHTHSPLPISTTVHKVARSFKKTHQDTWHEDSKKFTEEELSALSTLLTGSSYYA